MTFFSPWDISEPDILVFFEQAAAYIYLLSIHGGNSDTETMFLNTVVYTHLYTGTRFNEKVVLDVKTHRSGKAGHLSQLSFLWTWSAKIKGPDSGKTTSLPNIENVIDFVLQFMYACRHRLNITRLICIQWKSSRFVSPVSTVSLRNDHLKEKLLSEIKKKHGFTPV